MKKKSGVLFLSIALTISSIYLFVPSQINVGSFIVMQGTLSGISRSLQQQNNWKNFWQEEIHLNHDLRIKALSAFVQNKDTFWIANLLTNALRIDISSNDSAIISQLNIIPFARDSVILNWSYSQKTSANPFIRLQQYLHALSTKKNLSIVLNNMKNFLSVEKNIYGFTISETSTNDTLLVSTSQVIKNYPATGDIYRLIGILKSYIRNNNADATGNPLLNITALNENEYKLMVALPVNKKLEGNNVVQYKRMIPGRFISATINGGVQNINNAQQQIEFYFTDHQRTAMAIPFQNLITDRSLVNDTSKWITVWYFPVM